MHTLSHLSNQITCAGTKAGRPLVVWADRIASASLQHAICFLTLLSSAHFVSWTSAQHSNQLFVTQCSTCPPRGFSC